MHTPHAGMMMMAPALAMLVAGAVAADPESLVRGAVSEERTLGEITGRLGELQERQEESNVYSRGEVARTGEQEDSVQGVREKQYRQILEGLNRGSGDDATARETGYRQAGQGYQEALEILEETFRERGLRRSLENRQLLARQEALREETEKLAEDLQKQDQMRQEDLERLADLAEKQEALSKEAQEQLQKPMQEASDAIQEMKMPQAMQRQDQVLEELRRQVGEEMNNEQAQDAAALENMRRMEEALSAMEQQLRQAIEQQQPLANQPRQEMAMQMDQTARELAENQLPEAAKATEQAMEQLMQPNDPAAREQLRQALEQVQQRKQQMVQQRQQMQPQPPQNQPLQQEEERPPDGLQEGQRVAAAPGAEWQAGLPERERAALLTARQAKFDDRMAGAVKRYFLELAK